MFEKSCLETHTLLIIYLIPYISLFDTRIIKYNEFAAMCMQFLFQDFINVLKFFKKDIFAYVP